MFCENVMGMSLAASLLADGEEAEKLFRTADKARKEGMGDTTCVHGIVEFSNHCANNCSYCGLSASNAGLPRYRMTPAEIVDAVDYSANKLGYKMIVLQSGEDPYYTTAMLEGIIKRIKEKCKLLVFISIGDRDYDTYARLRKAGAGGVLYRFETSNGLLFKKLRPGTSLQTRLTHLKWMRELEYMIATGSMVGLPGQNLEDLMGDIKLLGKLEAKMASFGPYIPHPATPLAGNASGTAEMALKVIAATRMLYPKMRIPVTTALETLGEENRKKGLESGANALMVNLTPMKHREHYQIYPNKFGTKDEVVAASDSAISLVRSLGRRVCRGWGPWSAAPEFAPVCR